MPSNKGKNLIRFDSKNGKFCINGSQNVIDLNYLTKISIEYDISTKKIYGDGEVQMELVNDKGLTFTLGMTAICDDYEVAMKRSKEIANGIASIKLISKIEHGIYFEFNVASKNEAQKIVKCWMFNCTTDPAGETLDQSTEDINESGVEHTGYCKGTPLLVAGTSDEQATDLLGNKLFVTKVLCFPGMPGYASFESAIPVPRLKANAFDLDITATDTTVVVSRNGTEVIEGVDVLNEGDVITITATATSGTLSTLTLNGTTIQSGDTHTVTSDIAIIAQSE